MYTSFKYCVTLTGCSLTHICLFCIYFFCTHFVIKLKQGVVGFVEIKHLSLTDCILYFGCHFDILFFRRSLGVEGLALMTYHICLKRLSICLKKQNIHLAHNIKTVSCVFLPFIRFKNVSQELLFSAKVQKYLHSLFINKIKLSHVLSEEK